MDTAGVMALAEELVDALADATDHDVCDEHACLFCGHPDTRDVFTLMQSLERAIGTCLSDPDARASPGAQTAFALLARVGETPTYTRTAASAPPGGLPLDPRAADRLYVYLKAVGMGINRQTPWPRIET